MDDPFVIGEINPSLASRLRAFEGSDDLGNGRFDVCSEAADTIERYEAALKETRFLTHRKQLPLTYQINNLVSDALRSQDKGEG